MIDKHVADTNIVRKSNILTVHYFTAVDLSDDDYELSLTGFETYYMIRTVHSANKDDKEITIYEVSYKLQAIYAFLKQLAIL